MRIIRIVAEGVLNEIYDETNESLEDATKNITKMMKSDKVVTILGKNSSIVIRPSTVYTTTGREEMVAKQPIEKPEQKDDIVDEITDLES